MKKVKALLASVLSASVVLTSIGLLSAVAAGSADPFAPTTAVGIEQPLEGKGLAAADIDGGGLKFTATNTLPGHQAVLNKQYKFDGLHFKVENFTFAEGTRSAFTFYLAQIKTADYWSAAYGSTDNKAYTISVDLSAGVLKYFSPFASVGNGAQTAEIADIKGATSLDIYGVVKDDGYYVKINGYEYLLITKANYDSWGPTYSFDLTNVYVGFDGGCVDGQTEQRNYSFDLTSIHGGEVTCDHTGGSTSSDTSSITPQPEKDADAVLYAPTAAQWAIQNGDSLSHVTDLQDGGVHISFDVAGNTQTSIGSKVKYKWDGLHIRLENIKQPEGAALYISSASQFAKHYPAGAELQINILATDVSVYGNAWGNNDHPFGTDLTLGDTIDIRFSKTQNGDLELEVNGYKDSYTFLKENLAAAGIEDEVYVGFLNCFTTTKEYAYDVTVLHDGSSECKDGEPAPTEQELEALVKEVHDAIDALKAVDSITLDDEADIAAVRAMVDGLNASLKENLDADKLSKLAAAEAKITELKAAQEEAGEEKAQEVVEMIEAIVAKEITLDSEAAIVAAEEAYAALSEKHQALVTNYMDLALARVSLNALKESGDSTSSTTSTGSSSESDGKEPADTGVSAYPIFAAILLLTAGAAVVGIRKKKAM